MTTPMEPEIIQEAPTLEVGAPTESVGVEVAVETTPVETVPTEAARTPGAGGRGAIRGRPPRAGGRARPPRERGEFEQVTIDARRVARVMAGGRRFNFSLVV